MILIIFGTKHTFFDGLAKALFFWEKWNIGPFCVDDIEENLCIEKNNFTLFDNILHDDINFEIFTLSSKKLLQI